MTYNFKEHQLKKVEHCVIDNNKIKILLLFKYSIK